MSYNMLNFPTGNIQGRVDTLEKIVDYARPHLLMIQELKSAQGLASVTDMMNSLDYGDFQHSEFIEQQSPGSPGNLLQQAIVFDTEKLRLKSESVVLTDYRDINEFVLYLNDPLLPITSDTTFLYVYVTHLKSSTGADNELARLTMVNYLIEHFESLPPNANVIFAGDFNLYTNTEAAYTAITSTDNAIVMVDPFAEYGDWPGSNFLHKEILTQSTRVNQVAADGASGGLDDRFDFILFSESLMNEDNDLHFLQGSFESLGNTGNCYNENITDCSIENPVPAEVLTAMYYMSDHIPQVCQLHTDIADNIQTYRISDRSIFAFVSPANAKVLRYELTGFGAGTVLTIYNLQGQILYSWQTTNNDENSSRNIPQLQSGCYVIHACDANGRCESNKFNITE